MHRHRHADRHKVHLALTAVRDFMLGSATEFADRDLKGIPDQWRVLAVVNDPAP